MEFAEAVGRDVERAVEGADAVPLCVRVALREAVGASVGWTDSVGRGESVGGGEGLALCEAAVGVGVNFAPVGVGGRVVREDAVTVRDEHREDDAAEVGDTREVGLCVALAMAVSVGGCEESGERDTGAVTVGRARDGDVVIEMVAGLGVGDKGAVGEMLTVGSAVDTSVPLGVPERHTVLVSLARALGVEEMVWELKLASDSVGAGERVGSRTEAVKDAETVPPVMLPPPPKDMEARGDDVTEGVVAALLLPSPPELTLANAEAEAMLALGSEVRLTAGDLLGVEDRHRVAEVLGLPLGDLPALALLFTEADKIAVLDSSGLLEALGRGEEVMLAEED